MDHRQTEPQFDASKTYIDICAYDGMNDIVAVHGKVNLKLLNELQEWLYSDEVNCPAPWGVYRHEITIDPGDSIPHPSNPAFKEEQPPYYELGEGVLVEAIP